jgi:dTDP-4-dehydrorhamnose 3,5-epimerase
MKEFKDGPIEGVLVKTLKKNADPRGWLVELYRDDELEKEFQPVMAYISETKPGVVRGPHEHVNQADYFCFVGPSDFELILWDNRKDSPTYWNKMKITAEEFSPKAVLIPKGVVHVYKNIGVKNGWVFNAANQLYCGAGKKETVDEIRHEDDLNTPFKI